MKLHVRTVEVSRKFPQNYTMMFGSFICTFKASLRKFSNMNCYTSRCFRVISYKLPQIVYQSTCKLHSKYIQSTTNLLRKFQGNFLETTSVVLSVDMIDETNSSEFIVSFSDWSHKTCTWSFTFHTMPDRGITIQEILTAQAVAPELNLP